MNEKEFFPIIKVGFMYSFMNKHSQKKIRE